MACRKSSLGTSAGTRAWRDGRVIDEPNPSIAVVTISKKEWTENPVGQQLAEGARRRGYIHLVDGDSRKRWV